MNSKLLNKNDCFPERRIRELCSCLWQLMDVYLKGESIVLWIVATS